MAKNQKINEARLFLELEEKASILEIKEAYRKLSLKYHPDKCKKKDKKKCEEKFKHINDANRILIKYCLDYKFSFKEGKKRETKKEEKNKEHMKRFYDGWWDNLKDE